MPFTEDKKKIFFKTSSAYWKRSSLIASMVINRINLSLGRYKWKRVFSRKINQNLSFLLRLIHLVKIHKNVDVFTTLFLLNWFRDLGVCCSFLLVFQGLIDLSQLWPEYSHQASLIICWLIITLDQPTKSYSKDITECSHRGGKFWAKMPPIPSSGSVEYGARRVS